MNMQSGLWDLLPAVPLIASVVWHGAYTEAWLCAIYFRLLIDGARPRDRNVVINIRADTREDG